ncbi:MAG: sugar phosphate isomerase/epimerase [Deltaproteobacteria bacterium]|nr:sugar phosphate isomerase/epimerase [Deltaproteobacteria bacterium]
MLGISTCWWHGTSLKGDEIISDALGMGFEGVELDFRISNDTYQEMKPCLKNKSVALSIHNYFPKPDVPRVENGGGDLFLLSSEDRDERSMAVNYSTKSIEHANDLGCRVVNLHLGRVNMPSPTKHFKELFSSGKITSVEGLAFLKEQRRIRKSIHRKHLDAALFSLEKLNRIAENNNVFLGIENRYHFHEIPDFDEIGFILKEFKGSRLRYWHDVGHAQVHENIGICKQKDLLDAYSGEMLGIHLHDIQGLDDHFAPGQGEMDFNEIRPFLRQDVIKIMEINSEVEREALAAGRDVIIQSL